VETVIKCCTIYLLNYRCQMTEYNDYIIKYQLHHEIITIRNIYHLLALKSDQ